MRRQSSNPLDSRGLTIGWVIAGLLLCSLMTAPAAAVELGSGEFGLSLDTTISWGMNYRLSDPDLAIVGEAKQMVLLVAFHLLYPLRHQMLEGPVAWTEEGHRFSWRMMLRWKSGYGHFTIVDPATGNRQSIQPSEYLSPKQTRKLFSHPDMILQFAHYLRDSWCDKGIEDVQVYATIKAQLNGRPYQPYIDPEVDLAAEEWDYLKETHWIIPLNMPEMEAEEEDASLENE